jgi:apolipoprotein N-acyltransferase
MTAPVPLLGYQSPQAKQNGYGVAALVLGIVAIPLMLLCFLGVPCSIFALIFGTIGMKRAERGQADNGGMAKAGFILGIIGIGLLLAWIALFVIIGLTGTASN